MGKGLEGPKSHDTAKAPLPVCQWLCVRESVVLAMFALLRNNYIKTSTAAPTVLAYSCSRGSPQGLQL